MKDINGYFINRKLTRKRINLFLEKHRSNKLTLDIGSQKSRYKCLFPNSVAFDIDKLSKPDIVGDAHDLSIFEDEYFDIILCTEVLEHLKDPKIAIAEMRRVLKKKGRIIMTTRFIFPIHDSPNDYYRFTKYGLLSLFKDFKVIELKEESNTIETVAIVLQRIGFQTEVLHTKILKLFFFFTAEIIKYFSFFILICYLNCCCNICQRNLIF